MEIENLHSQCIPYNVAGTMSEDRVFVSFCFLVEDYMEGPVTFFSPLADNLKFSDYHRVFYHQIFIGSICDDLQDLGEIWISSLHDQ